MRRLLPCGICALIVIFVMGTSSSRASFTAYDDLKWDVGQTNLWITTYNPSETPSGGALVDYVSHATIGATVSFSGAATNFGNAVTAPTGGSDAYNMFNGIVDQNSYTYLSLGDVTMTFSNLDPAKTYEFAYFATRGGASLAYSNRQTHVIISSVSAFTNASSSGSTVYTTSVANDSTYEIAANLDGKLIQYVGINPGPDGTIVFTLRGVGTGGEANIGYGNAFRLKEIDPAGGGSSGGFISYNDAAWHQDPGLWNPTGTNSEGIEPNAVNFSTNSPWAKTSGTLIADDGSPLAATVTFSGSPVSLSMVARNLSMPASTDLSTVFAGKIGTNNTINWLQGTLRMTLASLDSSRTYNLAIWSSRGGTTASYSNRTTDIVLSSVDAFTNSSSSGMARYTTTMANDSVHAVAVIDSGRLARWDSIQPGVDGTIVVDLTASGTETNGYLNAFMLQENTGPVTPVAPIVANGTPTVLGPSSATMAGSLSSTGYVPTEVWLYWKSGSDGGTNKASWPNSTGLGFRSAGALSYTANALASNTTYYYRYYASNSVGDTWASSVQSFTTPAGVATVSVAMTTADRRQWYAANRRAGLIVSEIMFNPPNPYTSDLEFIELYNTESYPETLTGWKLRGDIEYDFPTGQVIGARSYLVIAKNPTLVQNTYGIANVLGPFSNTLPDSGTIKIKDDHGAILFEGKYSDTYSPKTAGAGHSLVLTKPDYGSSDVRAWEASSARLGNPGTSNRTLAASYTLQNVCINEFMAHTDPPNVDYIELFNTGTSAVDISGCYVSDSKSDLTRFQIPGGTILNARSARTFNTNDLHFSLSKSGSTLYLMNPSSDVILDAVKYESQQNGVPMGRWPDGQPGWQELTAATTNAANTTTTLKIREVVINEIMYHPIEDDDLEYVELYNRASTNINVGYWRFTDGIDFMIPPGTVIAGSNYLVIAKDLSQFLAQYTNVPASRVIGDFDGALSDSGERIALSKPDDITLPYQDFVVMDEVTYSDGWGKWSDGDGSSLELRDPRADNRLAGNWADSDETSDAPWCTIEKTAVLDDEDYAQNLDPNVYLRQVSVYLTGAGECLIDELHLTRSSTEFVQNPTLDGGSSSWVVSQGDHKNSLWESGTGYGSNGCIHLKATAGGNIRVDSVGATANDGLNPGDTIKLSIKARWLSGCRALNVQAAGNGVWAAGVLAPPATPGTPGARNSRYATNAGPDIASVWYSPILPRAGSNVVVSVSLRDVDGVQGADIKWRLDPATSYSTLAMNDSGTGGDRLSGDGIWSGTLSGQAYTNVVGFYVLARDNNASQATSYSPGLATPGTNEVYILFGMTNGAAEQNSYGVFRYIMPPSMDRDTTSGSYWSWDRMDDMYMNCTLLYNDSRMIPNVGTRLGGSIWTRPKPGSTSFPWWDTGRMPNTFREMNQTFRFQLPKSEPLCGSDAFQLDHMVNPSRGRQYYGVSDPVFLIEEVAYSMARSLGLLGGRERYLHLFGNDYHKCLIFFDLELPQDQVEVYMPDDADGDTYECKGWYECQKTLSNNDNGGGGPTQDYFIKSWKHDDGTLRDEMYRLLWDKKPNGGADQDVSSIVRVADAIDRPIDTSFASQKAYMQRLDEVVDWEQWARSFAMRQAICDWDAWGTAGRNMYMYVPKNGKAKLIEFDLDTGMGYEGTSGGSPGGGGGDWNAPLVQFKDQTLSNQFWACYAVKRAYWRGIHDMVDAMSSTNVNPMMDRRYYAHVSNNIAAYKGARPGYEAVDTVVMDPAELQEAKNFVADRRNFILTNGQYYPALTTTVFTASGPGTSGTKVFQITGNAPIMAKTLKVNGTNIQDVNVTWTSETAYSMSVAAYTSGNNSFQVTAWDRNGAQVGSVQNVTVNYTGSFTSPSGQVVISEIMFDPAVSDGGFVELYNKSATETYDLGGLRMNGVDFVFPAGSFIGPQQYRVVVGSQPAFYQTYTNDPTVVLGEYSGSLDNGGERISLEKMSINGGITNWTVLDTVRFDNERPWPNEAIGSGYSLQLIDVNQDNDRIANWATSRKWQYVTITGTAGSSPLYLYVENMGSAFIDDIKLVQGTVAGVGTDLITNGNFEMGFPGGWIVGDGGRDSKLMNGLAHSGNHCLRLCNSVAGAVGASGVYQSINVTAAQQYTLSYWYLPSSTGSHFTVRTSGNWITSTPNVPVTGAATPGTANTVIGSLSATPNVVINEIMPNNSSGSGIQDNGGDFDPWLELYNNELSSVNLSGSSFYLTDDYDNFTKWQFTGSQTLASGARQVVWCDNEVGEHSPSANPHTSFRLSSTNGTIALVQINNSRTTIVDYVNYSMIPTNKSQGLYPEGDPMSPQIFDMPTLGTANNASSIVVTIKINEWMADNAEGGVISDPADSDFDDWFELYNPNASPADLTGYMLTDMQSNSNAFVIPSGTVVPGLGRVLVWADNETGQNGQTNHLHVNFKLANGGETITLYRPDGTMVDGISFTNQRKNIAEGRYPDGSMEVYEMAIPTPNAPNRLFAVTVATNAAPGTVSLSWNALPGKEYQIWGATNIGSTNWTVLTGTNLPAGNATNLTFTVPTTGNRDFFRLIQK